MDDADLYTISNKLPRRDAVLCLEQYATKIKWKKNYNKIIDIGSGDGGVTNILQQYIPSPYTILGADKCKKMIDFASRRYGNENISFNFLDIEEELPEKFKGQFNLVFSSFAFHWINKQEHAFRNIYQLLEDGGNCLVFFFASVFGFDVYRALAQNDKWSAWVYDVDRFVSCYMDSQEPEKEITPMLEKIGFVNVDVQCRSRKYFLDKDVLHNIVQAVNPFKIPKHLYDDFLTDYYEVLTEMNIVEKINGKYFPVTPFDYRLITIFASKPNVSV